MTLFVKNEVETEKKQLEKGGLMTSLFLQYYCFRLILITNQPQ
jgi:hypothetical protein